MTALVWLSEREWTEPQRDRRSLQSNQFYFHSNKLIFEQREKIHLNSALRTPNSALKKAHSYAVSDRCALLLGNA
jgi:hypothetical protein